jgi:hypothetical protein
MRYTCFLKKNDIKDNIRLDFDLYMEEKRNRYKLPNPKRTYREKATPDVRKKDIIKKNMMENYPVKYLLQEYPEITEKHIEILKKIPIDENTYEEKYRFYITERNDDKKRLRWNASKQLFVALFNEIVGRDLRGKEWKPFNIAFSDVFEPSAKAYLVLKDSEHGSANEHKAKNLKKKSKKDF